MYVFVLSTTVLCGKQNPIYKLHCGSTYSCSSHWVSGLKKSLSVYFPKALILDAVDIFMLGFMVRKFDIKANKLHRLYETINSPGVGGLALLLCEICL